MKLVWAWLGGMFYPEIHRVHVSPAKELPRNQQGRTVDTGQQ